MLIVQRKTDRDRHRHAYRTEEDRQTGQHGHDVAYTGLSLHARETESVETDRQEQTDRRNKSGNDC
jgi:hypothetical protein